MRLRVFETRVNPVAAPLSLNGTDEQAKKEKRGKADADGGKHSRIEGCENRKGAGRN